jgi:uncharacterized membrane protein
MEVLMADLSHYSLLRKSLAANAVFTGICGLVLLVFSGTLTALLGPVGRGTLLILGAVLLLYALDLARTAFGAEVSWGRVVYFIIMDVLWVIGSIVVLLTLPFTEAGEWIVLGVADVVGLFALLQGFGLRRGRRAGATAPPTGS